jgi:cytochrome P450
MTTADCAVATSNLARLEIGVALPGLLRRFPGLRLDADPDELGWRWNASVFVVGSLAVAS